MQGRLLSSFGGAGRGEGAGEIVGVYRLSISGALREPGQEAIASGISGFCVGYPVTLLGKKT